MNTHPHGGVHTATICPMTEDGALDRPAIARHFADMAAVDGMDGLLLNGHAGEGIYLAREEACEVVRIARGEMGPRRLIAAVSAEATDIAAADAKAAMASGADAIMVFAPFSWALGADPRAIVAHHRGIAAAAGGAVYLFQGSVGAARTAYSDDVLARLLEIETVVGIKEGSWETRAYEGTLRLVRRLRPDVAVMASGDEHLFSCFQLGSDGTAVSLAAVVPELIVALERHVAAGETEKAKAIHTRLYGLARVVYGAPGHLASARLKACLKLLGRLESAACRKPTPVLEEPEIATLRDALATCLEISL